MALDILEGDRLVVGSTEYLIRSVAEWDAHGFAGGSFALGKSVSCSTKRPPSISGGKRGAAAENLTGLTCTPLDPVTPEIAQTAGIDSPHELLQTFLGDGTDYMHLVLEEIKTS